MSQPESRIADRASELASDFTSGDIDRAGLEELLGLLQHPEHGRTAGAAAWYEIDTAAAVRASEPKVFLDQLALRLGGNGKAVARAVAERIGRIAPGLPQLSPPSPRHGRTPPWWLLFAIPPVLAALIIGIYLHWSATPPPLATVIAIDGVVGADDGVLIAGRQLEAGPLVVPVNTRLSIRLDGGGTIILAGPASAVLGGGQCAIASGRIAASGPVLLALPDAAVVLAPSDQVVITVEDGTSAIGSLAGHAQVAPAGTRSESLEAGLARIGPAKAMPWNSPSSTWWEAEIPTVEPPGTRRVAWADAAIVHSVGRLRGEGRLAGHERELPWNASLVLRRRPNHLEILADGVSLGRWPGAWAWPAGLDANLRHDGPDARLGAALR